MILIILEPKRTDLCRVFVYGTLKKHQPNHFMLLNPQNGYSQFLYHGKTKIKFPLIIATPFNKPKLIDQPGIGHRIFGEIYEIDIDMFQKIDILENYPDESNRKLLKIELFDGRLYTCYVYSARNYPNDLMEDDFLTCYFNNSKYQYCVCERPKQINFSVIQTHLLPLFVYGTLKRNQPNNFWLNRSVNGIAKFVGCGKTEKKFPLVLGTRYNYPFLLNAPGIGNRISGEIYEIDTKMMEALDIFEYYPVLYDRHVLLIEMKNDGSLLPCWVYMLDDYPKKMMTKTHLANYTNTKKTSYCQKSTSFILNDLTW